MFCAASFVLNTIEPATSSSAPLLVPLSLERVKIPPTASLAVFETLANAEATTVPLPLGANVISPLAPSVMVILPVVELPVCKIKL